MDKNMVCSEKVKEKHHNDEYNKGIGKPICEEFTQVSHL